MFTVNNPKISKYFLWKQGNFLLSPPFSGYQMAFLPLLHWVSWDHLPNKYLYPNLHPRVCLENPCWRWSSEHLECRAALGLHFTWQQRVMWAAMTHVHIFTLDTAPPWKWWEQASQCGALHMWGAGTWNLFLFATFQAVREERQWTDIFQNYSIIYAFVIEKYVVKILPLIEIFPSF